MKKSLDRLVQALVKLPGIGPKTAQRIAFYLLKQDLVGQELSEAVTEARTRLRPCSICYSLDETERCAICTDQNRDPGLVCVVENPADVLTLEQSGQHRGTYHVLGGVLSPIDGVGPEHLHIAALLERVGSGAVREVIVATNPTTEGEATAIYLARQLRPLPVKVTRIARGLPVGSDLDLADGETLSRAFEGRREL